MKRRALVLTTESARHPFRASLPPHVFIVPREEEEVLAARERQSRAEIISDIKNVAIISFFGLLFGQLTAFQSQI